MFTKTMAPLGLVACIGMIITCFIPWVHYNSINETFTGFHVTKFATGNYYGRAGIIISVFTAVIFLFMILPRLWAKRVNLFLAALLFAYCLRTYIIFTSALFEGEVEKKAGIYLIIVFSFIMLLGAVFPRIGEKTSGG